MIDLVVLSPLMSLEIFSFSGLLTVAFVLAGVFALSRTVKQLLDIRRLQKIGIQTAGTIIRHDVVWDTYNRASFNAVVSFYTHTGQLVSGMARNSERVRKTRQPGPAGSIDVRYNPQNPEEFLAFGPGTTPAKRPYLIIRLVIIVLVLFFASGVGLALYLP